MASERLNNLRAMAGRHGGEFQVDFSKVSVFFGSGEQAAPFEAEVRTTYRRSVDISRDVHEGRVRTTLVLG